MPAAVALLGVFGFLFLGFAGLPLIDRYLLLPSALLAAFAGVALVRWRHESGSWRTGMAVVAALSALLIVLDVPDQLDGVRDSDALAEDRAHAVTDARRTALAHLPDSCRALAVADDSEMLGGTQPELAWFLERPTIEIQPLRGKPLPARGAALVPIGTQRDLAGWRPLGQGEVWVLAVRGC
jgi:hypothetical protein